MGFKFEMHGIYYSTMELDEARRRWHIVVAGSTRSVVTMVTRRDT
jgi:hypothetical protein